MLGMILEASVKVPYIALNAGALTGATSLTVSRPDEIPGSGELEIVGAYTSVDPVTGVMVLALPTTQDLEEGDTLALLPKVPEKWASVEVQAQDDAIFALVPFSLWDRVPEGVREPEAQEYVVIDKRNDDWVVLDVLGTELVQDGSYIDPDTAPTPSEVSDKISLLVNQVNTQGSLITENTTNLENVTETAEDAGSLAAIADLTTTVSDFPPGTADANGKRDGSLWITRTRPRINWAANPSFENNTTGWTATRTAMTRESSYPLSIAGSYTCKLTNSGTAGTHDMTWDGGGAAGRPAATEGQSWAASIYAAAVSGTHLPVFVSLVWYNGAGTEIGTTAGTAAALLVDDLKQFEAVGVAPANTATVGLRVTDPTGAESAIWRIDGAMLEQDDITGKYFDGNSYDGEWVPKDTTTPGNVVSKLNGGRIIGWYELDDGGWIGKQFTGTALVDIDASDIAYASTLPSGKAGMDGELIQDGTIPQDKMAGIPCTASEALLAGDLVNVHNFAGSFRMRKATAATPGKQADGYVLADVASGAAGFYYTFGWNPFVTLLSPGPQFLSTTAGKCSGSPPSAVGTFHQPVGVAGAAVLLSFTPGRPVKIT